MKYSERLRAKLRKKDGPPRGPVTLYFTTAIYQAFKKACAPDSASAMLEEMMLDFLEEPDSAKKK